MLDCEEEDSCESGAGDCAVAKQLIVRQSAAMEASFVAEGMGTFLRAGW